MGVFTALCFSFLLLKDYIYIYIYFFFFQLLFVFSFSVVEVKCG